MTITSPTFTDGGVIPKQYTCDGAGVSPALSWSGAPAETKSYVLLIHDPDAPAHDWLHWLVINIPPTTTAVAENTIPVGGTQLPNDSDPAKFGDFCPPNGEHRYVFEIYALDVATISSTNRAEVEQVLFEHTLDKAVLVGRYQRR